MACIKIKGLSKTYQAKIEEGKIYIWWKYPHNLRYGWVEFVPFSGVEIVD